MIKGGKVGTNEINNNIALVFCSKENCIYSYKVFAESTFCKLSLFSPQAGSLSFDGSAKSEKKEQDERFVRAREVQAVPFCF